jgi:hypothetical protein
MVTIGVLLTLHLPGVQSLKEKRAIVRSVVERLRSRRQLSAAEVGLQDRLQQAQVGFAVVSGDLATARSVVEDARRFVDRELLGRAEVVNAEIDEMMLGSD